MKLSCANTLKKISLSNTSNSAIDLLFEWFVTDPVGYVYPGFFAQLYRII